MCPVDILGELIGAHPDPGDVPCPFDDTSGQGSSLNRHHVTRDLLRRRCEILYGVRVYDGILAVKVMNDV